MTTSGCAVIPTLHIPLRHLALCLDCEACFDMRCRGCPACGGETWVPLAGFLETRGSRLRRLRVAPLTAA